MNRTEYLLTSRGAYNRFMNRYIRDFCTYCIYGNPKSKGTMKKEEKLNFQLELLKQMKANRKRSYNRNTKICIDMWVYVTKDNPPHIHKIPKNYLDLLSTPVDKSIIKRKKLLFEDDMQVSYLNVKYIVDKTEKARIEMTVYKYSSFIEDLRLADSILHDNINHFEGTIDSVYEDDEAFDEYASAYDELSDYKREQKNMSTSIDENVNKWNKIFADFKVQRLQETFLRMNNFNICEMFRLLGENISYENSIKPKKFQDIVQSSCMLNNVESELINLNDIKKLESLVRIKMDKNFKIYLPQLPTNNGKMNVFKNKIRSEMKNFKIKNKFLDSLLIPVSLKVSYKPPLTSVDFHKDLDNIMRIIVPIFHDEFKPPISRFQRKDYYDVLVEDRDKYYQQYMEKLPKGINYQILGYEIVEIPRSENDESDGYLTVGIADAFSNGLLYKVWEVIDELIDD